jgi:hypothetical protein
MEFVIGNIDNILTDKKTKLNDEVIITFGNINSKSELRRNMAQMTYFIMNDKEIEPQTKIKLITDLQGTYNKAKEELIKKKLVVEDEDEKVKTQQVELNKRIVLDKHPNRNGNLLKSININVNASKYPISARDQVDFFLLDIAEEFDMLMNPDKADEKLQDKLSRVIETTDKFIPNDFSKGKNTDTTDDDKNKAAPKASDVKSLQDEVKEIEEAKKLQKKMKNAYSNNPLDSAFSMFGLKSDDKFPYDDNEVIEAYKHFENTVDKKKAAGAVDEVESQSSKSSKTSESSVSLGGKKRKTRKNRKNAAGGGNTFSLDPLDYISDYYHTKNMSKEQAENFRRLRAEFRKTPSLTARKVKREQELFDNTRTYRPEELQHRTLTQQELYDRLGGKKRKTKKNKKKNQKRKTSKRKQKQK